ncbi:hypothetical protein ACFFMP_10715 [Pseudoroseomonas cervicalis]
MRRLAAREPGGAIPGAGRRDEIGAMAAAVRVFRESMAEGDRLAAAQRAEQAERRRPAPRGWRNWRWASSAIPASWWRCWRRRRPSCRAPPRRCARAPARPMTGPGRWRPRPRPPAPMSAGWRRRRSSWRPRWWRSPGRCSVPPASRPARRRTRSAPMPRCARSPPPRSGSAMWSG